MALSDLDCLKSTSYASRAISAVTEPLVCSVDSRESSTTRCYILTDEQYLCSDKSAIYFEPDASKRVMSTELPDDDALDVEGSARASLRGDGYIPLTR